MFEECFDTLFLGCDTLILLADFLCSLDPLSAEDNEFDCVVVFRFFLSLEPSSCIFIILGFLVVVLTMELRLLILFE